MNKIVLLGFILLVIGCSEIPQKEYTAQESLLRELENCNCKFGCNSASQRELNSVYCNKLLVTIDELVRDGYFESNIKTDKFKFENQNNQTNEINNEIDKLTNDIIGDI